MPRIETRTFRVRYYECDAYGHLNNVNYLRYMQEAAFDASAAAGYDMAHLEAMQRQWWVHATEIEYLQPLRYNECVEVKTWVADFRKMSSRRRYELRRESDGVLAARGFSDWVYVDISVRQPALIPPEMIEAFMPEGAPERFPPRPAFPSAPPPPPGAFSTTRRVRWQDLDTAQHVNNATYLEYIEDCGMQVIAAHNWPLERMAEAGFALVIRSHQIQYRQAARAGDELILTTWLSNVRRSQATRHYTIQRASDGELLMRANSLGVFIDLDTLRPIRVPEGVMKDFAPNVTQG